MAAALGCGDASPPAVDGSTTAATTGSAAAPTTGTAASSAADTSGASSSTGGGAGGDTTGAGEASGGESTGSEAGGEASSGGETSSGGAGSEASSGEASGGGSTGEDSGAPVIPGPKVKVITFNIRVGTANDGENAWDQRKPIVFDYLLMQDADVIGMQEDLRFQLLAIDDAVAGYKRVGRGTVDGMQKGPYNAIYFKKERFMLGEWDTFALSDTPGQAGSTSWGNEHPRAVTWARLIEKDTGYGFYVFNTHFDHISQNSRERSAALLAERVADRAEDEPFVVTGDFNAAEGNLAVRYLKKDAKIGGQDTPVRMVDTFRVHDPDATAVGTAHGFNGGTGGNKIDYVWAQPATEVVNAYISHYNVDGRYPSDHFPVVGVVRFVDKP
ncbi:MAG: endonuclease/exonuclease/phosphatase family protein [Myxococcales bacterium]|nr:endonuclease/exonuclease/phosphatase family protein [Myxococcales bacterium]